jgi:hypothetical protein
MENCVFVKYHFIENFVFMEKFVLMDKLAFMGNFALMKNFVFIETTLQNIGISSLSRKIGVLKEFSLIKKNPLGLMKLHHFYKRILDFNESTTFTGKSFVKN